MLNAYQNYCPNCKLKNLTGKCPKCRDLPPTFIVSERDEILGTLIHDLKYSSARQIAKPLAEILNEILPDSNLLPRKETVIIPLPTISRHIRERGLDHTLLIAKKLAKLRGFTVQKILHRKNNTVQVGADQETRKKQASLAYEIRKSVDPKKTYILLDDVWTTGASMKEALKKLREAGALKIVIVVLAVNRLN